MKQTLTIDIIRKNNKTFFSFEIPPKLQEVYKNYSKEVKKSNSWKDLEFYFCPDITQDECYKKMLNNYGLFDDFGLGLYSNNKLNVAWLRTKGGKGKIEVKGQLPYAEMNIKIKQAITCIKEYFDDYLRAFHIKGHLEIEI